MINTNCQYHTAKEVAVAAFSIGAIPGTGVVRVQFGEGEIAITYCPACLMQVAYLKLNGSREVKYCELRWTSADSHPENRITEECPTLS